VRFLIDGETRLAWNFAKAYPRPCFYPLIGPAGVPLTRMGHPGAPNHDHHQSVWFAHADIDGTDFWSNQQPGRIEQTAWQCYEDGDSLAAMAVQLAWKRPGGAPLLNHALVALLRPLPAKEYLLELQSTLTPAGDAPLTIRRSNFGMLAVRVAKSLSVHFGGGKLTSSEGAATEEEGFGQFARWWDYSGPIANGQEEEGSPRWNGITYFDHPANPHYPAHWHVREDGWMGASLTRNQEQTLSHDSPVRVRYLLHIHDGAYDPAKAEAIAINFAEWPFYHAVKSRQPHRAFELAPRA
jgi:hypothetical protein